MESVYKIYCASYDHALQLVESYRRDPRLHEEILDTLSATVWVPAAEPPPPCPYLTSWLCPPSLWTSCLRGSVSPGWV